MSEKWGDAALGDAASVIAGQSPDGSAYNAVGKGMPFYQGKKEFGERFIGDPSTWTTQVKRVAVAGDILMSVRAPVGPVNLATQECCIGRGLAAIRSGPRLNRDFLFYYLVHKQDQIAGTEGAVFASINKDQIEAIREPWHHNRWLGSDCDVVPRTAHDRAGGVRGESCSSPLRCEALVVD